MAQVDEGDDAQQWMDNINLSSNNCHENEVLFDPGSTSWTKPSVLPPGANGTTTEVVDQTIARTFKSTQKVVLIDVTFPQVHHTCCFASAKARVFSTPRPNDMGTMLDCMIWDVMTFRPGQPER
jgi:hypothetical protein